MNGTDLRLMRRMSGLTQTTAAKAAGIDRSMLSLAECNERPLTQEQERRVVRVLRRVLEQRSKKISAALEIA